jgi:hypothetical protein
MRCWVRFEERLAGICRGELLAHEGIGIATEAGGELRQLLCGPGAGPAADGGPFAGEHGAEDRTGSPLGDASHIGVKVSLDSSIRAGLPAYMWPPEG